jgi:aryl-alcohol dehydrogenase-like predicted oxidoreductase
MNLTRLGPLDGVSRLTLGGGGLGRIWGETSIDEAVATVHAAVAGGITLIDTAPMYRDCEQVIDEASASPPSISWALHRSPTWRIAWKRRWRTASAPCA